MRSLSLFFLPIFTPWAPTRHLEWEVHHVTQIEGECFATHSTGEHCLLERKTVYHDATYCGHLWVR